MNRPRTTSTGRRSHDASTLFTVRCSLFVAVLLAVLVPPVAAFAHPAVSAVAVVKIEADGRFTITLNHDALAFALNEQPSRIADGPMLDMLAGPREDLVAAFTDAKERLESGMHVTADGSAPVAFTITESPQPDAALRWKADHPRLPLPVKLDFVAVGSLPAKAGVISVQFPAALGDVILLLDRPGVEPLTLPLTAGEATPPLPPLPVRASASGTDRPGVLSVARRYTVMGFTHIIPQGSDHALFVLGLFLLSPRLKSVLWQITTFTIAHSITLFLSTFKVISVSSAIVEPTIAATIMFIAVENLFVTRVHPWRPAVAFIFGLVHGMGFASALREVGLPTGQLVTGVIAFNVGVELGHLTVLAAALLLLGWWRDRSWYRGRVSIPLSLGIAGIAGFWMVQRIAGG